MCCSIRQGCVASCAGHDVPFVNNYGVWKDEFRELGLESTLDMSWDDASCYFGEGQQVRVGRGYGRRVTPASPFRDSGGPGHPL